MEKSISLFHWLPRIIGIIAILFVSMFALDTFAPERTILQQISDFLIHLIPSFILVALLIVAWKWEYIGGIIFAIIGISLSPFVFVMNHNQNHFSVWQSMFIVLIITIPFALVGFLFIVSHKRRKRKLPVGFRDRKNRKMNEVKN